MSLSSTQWEGQPTDRSCNHSDWWPGHSRQASWVRSWHRVERLRYPLYTGAPRARSLRPLVVTSVCNSSQFHCLRLLFQLLPHTRGLTGHRLRTGKPGHREAKGQGLACRPAVLTQGGPLVWGLGPDRHALEGAASPHTRCPSTHCGGRASPPGERRFRAPGTARSPRRRRTASG